MALAPPKKGKNQSSLRGCWAVSPDRLIRTLGNWGRALCCLAQLSNTSAMNPVTVLQGRKEKKKKRVLRTIHNNHCVIFFSWAAPPAALHSYDGRTSQLKKKEERPGRVPCRIIMITITQVAAGDEEEVSSPTIATRAYVE